MNDQQGSQRISSGVIAAVSAAVVAVGGGVAWLASNQSPTPTTPSQTITQPNNQPSTTQPEQEQTPNVYWLKPRGESVDLVPQPIQIAATQPDQVLEKAFQALLAGPTEGTDSTTIPQETKLLGVKTENDEVRVNLSGDFTTGGGTTSMIARIGQVVYTATTINPKAKVYIDVEGEQLDVLGGEGVELQQPLTRESFEENYPL
ncbi:GerMN domain-containing protein [Umezakia ovalisporum]|jgi:spore germination protein GerM|uniref:GerMN domain-containing protein n=2 Tax=Umezakia ovalisporum TaxID=75695 RepID=A0AA43H1I7_9CYAN|nr:GerMN domain-containing protein [Umezakia ovalisporum]MBI1240396.1 spore germination protein [Nostoc sp. RI_552]MDH6056000.1 GerMN domain-containing protein [Umezakia ovalisporum FSS-43]MDH6065521.1 GerMN domain-containing protein [Umezakia ovalisporum FSS-62]MDH6066106.1 GerMN domain-containing protein [Umezakia ovalisporum APH033B]MDH6072632.1 GerMN domain-containing protein [Umezakia ovalisporum CobakiLakeA]